MVFQSAEVDEKYVHKCYQFVYGELFNDKIEKKSFFLMFCSVFYGSDATLTRKSQNRMDKSMRQIKYIQWQKKTIQNKSSNDMHSQNGENQRQQQHKKLQKTQKNLFTAPRVSCVIGFTIENSNKNLIKILIERSQYSLKLFFPCHSLFLVWCARVCRLHAKGVLYLFQNMFTDITICNKVALQVRDRKRLLYQFPRIAMKKKCFFFVLLLQLLHILYLTFRKFCL